MDTRQYSCLCRFRLDGLEGIKDKGLQLVKIHLREVDLMLLAVRTQFVQIHLVSLDGVGRITAFQS